MKLILLTFLIPFLSTFVLTQIILTDAQNNNSGNIKVTTEVNLSQIPDSLDLIANISNLSVVEIEKEVTDDKKTNDSTYIVSINKENELPKINKKWYGLDIISAAEVSSSNGSFFLRPINPPDVTLAVGNNHVAQMVHNSIQIWDKNGSTLAKKLLHDFFNISKDHYITDPILLYDTSDSRWFATIVDGGKEEITNGLSYFSCSPICQVKIAVSNSDDPTQNWSIFTINSTKPGNFPDLPKIAVSKNKLLLTTIEFPKNNDSKTFPKTYLIDKTLLINNTAGISGTKPTFEPNFPIFPIIFSNPSDCISTIFLYKENITDVFSDVKKVKITDYCNPADSGNYKSFDIPIPTLHSAPKFNQPLLNETNETKDNKKEITILSAIRNNNSVWIGLHTSCQPSAYSNNSCINILKFNKILGTGYEPERNNYTYDLTENTQFHIYNTDVFYPAIGISNDEKLFFISGFSNSTIFPSLMVSHLVAENKTQDIVLILGSAINNSNSYGDYFGSAIDPVDGTVWLSGQYVDQSIPIPSHFPPENRQKVQDKTWSTIITNVS